MNKQQFNIKNQTMSRFEKTIRFLSIVLIIVSTFEIFFFVGGYVGMVYMKIQTKLWFLWSAFYLIFKIITPIILVVSLPGAGYLIFRALKQRANRQLAIIVTIAAGINLLALISIFITEKGFSLHVQNTYGNIGTSQTDWTGKTLPEFTFLNIHEGLSPLTIKDLQQKPSVLIFWATYDTPWSSNFKIAQDLYNRSSQLNINVFAIAVDGSKDNIKKFLVKHPTNMPVYYDQNASFKHRLNIIGSVELVIIVDSMTKIQKFLDSPRSFEEIKGILDKIR